MPEQIYDKAELRKRAVEHLRKVGRHQVTGQVAMAIGVQFWAAEQALEDAYLAKEAAFHAGVGWEALPEPAARRASGEEQGLLGDANHG